MADKPNPKDLIRVKYEDKEYEGHLMPRPPQEDDSFITLKLVSGYDIGLKTSNIASIEVIEPAKEKDPPKSKYSPDTSKPNVAILATGGTIASRIDYLTGGVHSAFTAADLISAIPEMGDYANLQAEQVFNKFSENIQPEDWVDLAKAAYNKIEEGMAGIVITHGTDTMGYSAAALSFMLNTPIPLVLTGAQRSSDRGSSDAALNLIHATKVAAIANISGVFVSMHGQQSDTVSHLHWGTAVRKLHSSRRDAFKSVNRPPAAIISDDSIDIHPKTPKRGGETAIDTSLCKDVALIKYYPGMTAQSLESALYGVKGAIIEGTGLGHVAEPLIETLSAAVDSGTLIYMATQTVYGRTNLSVYSTGRKIKLSGVGACRNMMAETAYVKLMCVLGREKDTEAACALMESDLAGEYWG